MFIKLIKFLLFFILLINRFIYERVERIIYYYYILRSNIYRRYLTMLLIIPMFTKTNSLLLCFRSKNFNRLLILSFHWLSTILKHLTACLFTCFTCFTISLTGCCWFWFLIYDNTTFCIIAVLSSCWCWFFNGNLENKSFNKLIMILKSTDVW